MKSYIYALLVLISSGLIILSILGIADDIKGKSCSGIAGAKISCLEQYTIYPFGTIAIPIIVLLISVLFIDRLKIDAGQTEVKPKKRR
jgi:hypothetical protein